MKCPKCSGFVHHEGWGGSSPPNDHCLICGWRKWEGFEVRQPKNTELKTTVDINPGGLSSKMKAKADKRLKKLLRGTNL